MCNCNTYNPCSKHLPKDCDCQVKDLGTKCVIYDGEGLTYLEVEKNTNTTIVFEVIDGAIQELREYIEDIDPQAVLTNYGGGTYTLYAGKDVLNRHRIKTLNAGENIDITETPEGVLEISSQAITEVNITGDNYLQVQGTETNYQLSFDYSRVESADIYTVVNADANGISVGVDIAEIAGYVDVNISSDTLDIVKNGTSFTINTVPEGVKRFYVNNLYSGNNSDGSESKPFKNILDALTAFVGTGTNINPQYASQNAEIVVKRSGITYNLPSSLLYKNLRLNVESGVTLQTVSDTSNYLIDYDSLPGTTNGYFPIRIVGQGKGDTTITVRQPLVKNSLSYNSGGATPMTESAVFENIRLYISKSSPFFDEPTLYAGQPPVGTNRGTHWRFQGCDIWNEHPENVLIKTEGAKGVFFDSCEIRFKVDFTATNLVSNNSFEYAGGAVDFTDCRIKAYREFTNGVISIQESVSDPTSSGKIVMKGCIFEGDPPSWFTVENGAEQSYSGNEAVEISNADYFYGADPNTVTLVNNNVAGDTEMFKVYNSYFSCSLGDADLTKADTLSVSNYFSDSLREDLLKSETILTIGNSSFRYGTPYLYTPTVADKTTWERRVVV